MIYQNSTVMAQSQNKKKSISPIISLPFHSLLSPPPPLIFFQKKGSQSVTHYIDTQLPQCTNHRKRRAVSFADISGQGRLYFCQRCREMVQRQGFGCTGIEEFNGISTQKQNIGNSAQSHKKQRKNGLDDFLQAIKNVHKRATHIDSEFELIVQQDLSKNSQQISILFQQLETEVQNMKSTYQSQMETHAENMLNYCKELRCGLRWTQEQLQHLISKITKNTDRLINDHEFYTLNTKVLRENLAQKQRKITVTEKDCLTLCSQFKQQNQSIALQLTAKIYQIKHVLDASGEISGIRSFESHQDEVNKTFREIVGEMSTHHTLI